MALKPVTDPTLLAQLDTTPAPAAAPAGLKPVTDPAILAQLEGAPPATSQPKVTNPYVAAGEVALKGVTGLASAVPGAAAYGATAVGNALGLTDKAPRESMREAQDYFTYRPKTESGQAADTMVNEAGEATVGRVLKPVVQAADKAASKVGEFSPTAENVLREAPYALEAAGVVAPAVRPVASAVKATTKVSGAAVPGRGDAVEAARALGYKVRPSDVRAMRPGEKVPGLKRESFSGSSDLKRDFTVENQAVTTRLAAEELGAQGKAAITPKVLRPTSGGISSRLA
jgi:hypothetical protein